MNGPWTMVNVIYRIKYTFLLNYHYSLLGSFARELTPLNNIFVFILLSYYQAIILHLKCCMTSVKLAKRPVSTYKYWSFQLFVKTMYTVTFAKPYMQNYFIQVIQTKLRLGFHQFSDPLLFTPDLIKDLENRTYKQYYEDLFKIIRVALICELPSVLPQLALLFEPLSGSPCLRDEFSPWNETLRT